MERPSDPIPIKGRVYDGRSTRDFGRTLTTSPVGREVAKIAKPTVETSDKVR
jgi:hypothetical protein